MEMILNFFDIKDQAPSLPMGNVYESKTLSIFRLKIMPVHY